MDGCIDVHPADQHQQQIRDYQAPVDRLPESSFVCVLSDHGLVFFHAGHQVCFFHPFFEIFAPNLALEVFFHHERSHRGGVGSAETAVFNVGGDGDLGVVHRGEADENGIVGTAGVLGRSGLAAHVQSVDVGDPGGSTHAGAGIDGPPHAFDDLGEMDRIDLRVLPLVVFRVDFHAFGGLDDVRDVIVAAVGDGSAQVGQVHRGGEDLSLADRQGNDCR